MFISSQAVFRNADLKPGLKSLPVFMRLERTIKQFVETNVDAVCSDMKRGSKTI